MTRHTSPRVLSTTLILTTTACSDDLLSDDSAFDSELESAFTSVPLGFDIAVSSYQGGPDGGQAPLGPQGRGGSGRGHGVGGYGGRGRHGGGLGGSRMGGGTADSNCAFDSATGRLNCEAVTHHGMTVQRSIAYADVNGSVQSAFETLTTSTVDVRSVVSGTGKHHNGGTSTVEHSSERIAAAQAAPEPKRTS